jgi:hypothetical protein
MFCLLMRWDSAEAFTGALMTFQLTVFYITAGCVLGSTVTLTSSTTVVTGRVLQFWYRYS